LLIRLLSIALGQSTLADLRRRIASPLGHQEVLGHGPKVPGGIRSIHPLTLDSEPGTGYDGGTRSMVDRKERGKGGNPCK
jgi:hypothetical protein